MSAALQVPLWVAIVLAAGSPLLSFLGVLVAQWFTRRSASDTDERLRREETMRMLRWAAEMAASDDESKANVGVAALDALDDSRHLGPDDQPLITAILEAIVEPVTTAYDEGDDVVETGVEPPLGPQTNNDE